jgi:hypothetical protein
VGEAYPEGVSGPELARLRDRAVGRGSVARLLGPDVRSRRRTRLARAYGGHLAGVYRAAQRISGADVLIDSSKYPPDAYLLWETLPPGIELHLVHLVRHPGAVVYSWQKRKLRPEIHWKQEYMPRYPWWKAAGAWILFNLLLERLGQRPGVSYSRVRYEDLTRSPGGTLRSIATMLDIDASELSFLSDDTAELGTSHTVSGNPSRFRTGSITIRRDDEWERGLPAAQKRATALVTAPLRRKYGYGSKSAT